MNSPLTINRAPNNTIGLQLSSNTCITTCLLHLLPTTTGTHRKVHMKLTGDGSQIARGKHSDFCIYCLEKDLNPTSSVH